NKPVHADSHASVFTNTSTGIISKTVGTVTSVLSNISNLTFNTKLYPYTTLFRSSLAGIGTHSGTFTVPSGTTLNLAGTQTFASVSASTDTGNVIITGGTITFASGSSYDATLVTSQSAGTVTWNITSLTINSYSLT